jgi:AraC-like DNA-binding protein/ligand-binding sensor protein
MDFINVLYDNLQSYAYSTNITLTFLDKDGNQQMTFGQTFTYCTLFQEATGKYCPCSKKHHESCLYSTNLGESYIFSCPAGLIHFAVPIMKDKSYQGSVLAGPIMLEYPDISLIDSVIQKYNISLDYRRKMYTALTGIPLIEPFQARHLSKLLFLLITNLISGEVQRRNELSEKTYQQAKIGEYLQTTKENTPLPTTQYAMERSLIQDVLSGNSDGAKAMLNEMLGQIFFSSGNNIDIIKTRTIELVALLSRAVVESGSNQEDVYQMTRSFQKSLTDVKNLADLSYVLLETLDQFTNLAFYAASGNNLTLIKKSINYIHEHYKQNITLEKVADHIGLNPSYFSTLFKKDTGENFSTYLLNLRIETAKQLLRNTNLPLVDIAIEAGFDNQSYFSYVFRKNTGISPRQYRQTL